MPKTYNGVSGWASTHPQGHSAKLATALEHLRGTASGPMPGKVLNDTAGPKSAEHQAENDRHRMPKGTIGKLTAACH